MTYNEDDKKVYQTDLIHRGDAIKAVDETPFIRRPILPHYLKVKIKDIPSAENKGEWIDQDHGAFYPIECSRCHKEPLLDAYGEYVFSNYCPNCGARMKGAGDEMR